MFLLEAIYFGQHTVFQMCYRRGEKNGLTSVFAHERISLAINRFDFLILELFSAFTDFVYIEKIIDIGRMR